MNIALVHMRHALTGGTERYLNELAPFLARRGHRVTIVCRRHESAPHPEVRFAVLHGPALGKTWRMVGFARALERHLAGRPYELVFGLGKTWSHDVVRLGGGCHATYLDRIAAGGSPPWLRSARRAWLGALPRHRATLAIEARALAPGAYRRVIANSELARRDVVRRHGVPEARIATIGNGVDLERFHPRRREAEGRRARAELGLEAGAPALLFLGNGFERKGLDLVLRALPELRARRPAAQLLVVGRDAAWRRYLGLARALGLADCVRFLGPRPDPETWYAAADLFVLPSRFDPFANATLEALASGLPVITSATNGGAEVLEPGREGAVIDVEAGAEALARELVAWSAPERLRAGGPAARALAERHGIADKLAATERLLLEVGRELRP